MYKIPANTLFIGQNLIYVPECHSTNSLLNEFNSKSPLPEGTVLITDRQTAGRGQRGNSWESEPGMNLTFSFLIRPTFLNTKDQFQLSMAISLAVIRALQSTLDERIKLKWPNDIWVNDKKIGGILMENQLQGPLLACVVAGIGLNINQQLFSLPHAASLCQFLGASSDLNDIFQRLMTNLEAEYLELRAGKVTDLKQRYIDSLYKFGEVHHFEAKGESFEGSICDVDESGRLRIESKGNTRGFSFQEVRFLT